MFSDITGARRTFGSVVTQAGLRDRHTGRTTPSDRYVARESAEEGPFSASRAFAATPRTICEPSVGALGLFKHGDRTATAPEGPPEGRRLLLPPCVWHKGASDRQVATPMTAPRGRPAIRAPVGAGARIAGRYLITAPLGRGGMGSVFAGHDTGLDRPVAIKLLAPRHFHDPRATERMLREARAMARVVHPACVQVFDHGVDPEMGPYLVMERLNGEDLSHFLRAQGPLPQQLTLALIEQICSTVQAVHHAGIVHRDLKPANIFLLRHPPGTVPRVKLLDFGIAKVEDDAAGLTEPGDLLGTLAYMPPERWLTNLVADVRTDVYALGTILYELLSGDPPFRARTQAELRLAISNDDARPLRERRPDLAPRVASAVEKAMSKVPGERHHDVAAFMLDLGVAWVAVPSDATRPRQVGVLGSRGTARFRVDRCLAQGAESAVFAAHDFDQKRIVAIKCIRGLGGEASVRLKTEFRVAAEVRHPNLVRLEELWEEDGDLFLSMELIEGANVLDHVAGSVARLRSCLIQLGRGLHALHCRGIAHRDVKPENVLVRPNGHLTLLDYGLASRAATHAGPQGTMAYVAPEILQGQIGPEGDLFAVGLILFQGLTGAFPPSAAQPWSSHPTIPPSLPEHLLVDGAPLPADLAEMCRRLLAVDPAMRPTAAELVRLLEGTTCESSPADDGGGKDPVLINDPTARGPAGRGGGLIGRVNPLQILEDAVHALADGRPRIIWLEGPSGIGKTAVVEEFSRRLAVQGRALVLPGRAREGNSVPFPALDEAIDALGSYLLHLPREIAGVVVPRRVAKAARLFPSLARVEAVVKAGRTGTGPLPGDVDSAGIPRNPAQERLDAFDILRDMLRRLSDRQPVVFLIDDAQWIDSDSLALVLHLLGGSDPPPLLVVITARSDGASEGSGLPQLIAALPSRPQRLTLGPLSFDDSCALLHARWRGREPLTRDTLNRLAAEAAGVPIFLEMLASDPEGATATYDEGAVGASDDDLNGASLIDVIRARALALTEAARLALELICVAARSLPTPVILESAGLKQPADLDGLFAGFFIRSVRADHGWVVEPYHNRIREAVRGALSQSTLRARHQRLADVLRTRPGADPELLVEHLACSGDADSAAQTALKAADVANCQLAFDRAAALFAVALTHGRFDHEERVRIRRQSATALLNAGQRKHCGEMLLLAADDVSDKATAESLRREAGTHLLLAGDIQRGLQILAPALQQAGMSVPTSLAETIEVTTAALATLGQRDMIVPTVADPPDQRCLDRLDLALVLALGLAHIDLRVLPFACQALLAAFEAGDPRRLQQACALFVINTVEYLPNPLVAPALELCRQLKECNSDPYAAALFDAASAENAHFEGDFLAAEAAFERAERTLLKWCPGATRELSTVRDLAVFIQYAQKGDFRTQLDRTMRWLHNADAAHDIYHASMLRVAHAIVWIAQDRPQHARAELQRAQAEWLGEGGVLEVGAALYHDIIDRYEELDLADDEPSAAHSHLLRSPAAQTPFLSGYLSLQTAWKDLRALAAGRLGPEHRNDVRQIVARLRALGLPIWMAVGDALEANIDHLDGNYENAFRALDGAEQKFRRMSMLCLAACARKRRGQFTAGDLGQRLETEADQELRALGVANPDRWARAYWSMYDVKAREVS